MSNSIDLKKTIEIIEKMKLAKIGDYDKWEKIIKKINKKQVLNPEELEYYSNLTRIYKNSSITSRTKIYHTKYTIKNIFIKELQKNIKKILFHITKILNFQVSLISPF